MKINSYVNKSINELIGVMIILITNPSPSFLFPSPPSAIPSSLPFSFPYSYSSSSFSALLSPLPSPFLPSLYSTSLLLSSCLLSSCLPSSLSSPLLNHPTSPLPSSLPFLYTIITWVFSRPPVAATESTKSKESKAISEIHQRKKKKSN